MSPFRDFLVEIGTEELPPRTLLSLADAFAAGVASGLAAAIELEVAIADHLNEFRAEGFGSAAENDVAGGVGGFGFCAQFAALFVDDSFAADDDDVFLKVVDVFDAFDEAFEVERMLWDERDIRTAVGGAEREVAGMSAHDFDDGDTTMAFGGGADAFDALR